MTPEERAERIYQAVLTNTNPPRDRFQAVRDELLAALAEEREACARIADGADIICNIAEDQAARERRATTIDTGRMIASAIRRRT